MADNFFIPLLEPEAIPDPTTPAKANLASAVTPVPKKQYLTKAATQEQKTIGEQAAALALKNIEEDNPYQLAESGIKSGVDPSLTCIGALCNMYKDVGVDFSGLGGEKSGVRESRTGGKVVEYNPTFEKNYKKAGFDRVKDRPVSADELHKLIKNQELAAGDIIQFYDDKGKPVHSNMIISKDEDGNYDMYNGYKHSNYKRLKQPYVEKTNPQEYEKNPEGFEGVRFNVFRIGDDAAKKILAAKNKQAAK